MVIASCAAVPGDRVVVRDGFWFDGEPGVVIPSGQGGYVVHVKLGREIGQQRSIIWSCPPQMLESEC